MHSSQTGRHYYFEQEDNPFKPGEVSVRPTVIKNYFVQGLATGDIVPLVLGVLFRRLYSKAHLRGKMHIINTIHDSFLLDANEEVFEEVVDILRDTMERTPEWVEKFYGINFELPVKVKIKVGSNWHDLKEIK
jgi:DNA polymerase I-like protein with 3'-5' exonuclease and polymerase domains